MKKRLPFKRIAAFLVTLVMLVSVMGECAALASTEPYDSYNYDYRKYVHFTPAPYTPAGNVSTRSMVYNGETVGSLSNPQDLCIAPDGNIYIADTGNNRIIILNNAMDTVVGVISSFDNGGTEDTFSAPYGVCVSENEQIYIADSKNRRVVVLELDGSLARIVENPQSESLEDGFVFTPLKVTVDYADRLYVIAQNMFEGIMVFETDGQFSGFFGTIGVSLSLWEKFWKRIATKEERSKQTLYIPTEFTGLDIDYDGFVYATNIDSTGTQGVRRLNPSGDDVIKKGENENLGGDLWTDGSGDYAGASQFVDVVYRDNGIYSCLDRKRGRIFTYDHEGNLLYIFGGLGSQTGTFQLPVAIEDIGGRLIVLDATKAEIICFDETEYGSLINEAVALRYDGDEALAVSLWERVLELDENNELANVGMGKAYLSSGDYAKAMKYLKIGMNRDYYSIAFRRFRNAFLGEYASYFLTGLLLIIAAIVVSKRMIRKKRGVLQDE